MDEFAGMAEIPAVSPTLAAYRAGRLINRLKFHFQLRILVEGSGSPEIRACAQKHSREISKVFRTLRVLALDLLGPNYEELRSAISDAERSVCLPETFWDDLHHAHREYRSYPPEGASEMTCENLVKDYLPLLQPFANVIGKLVTRMQFLDVFELGKLLDEGLCRPDVFRFMEYSVWPDLRHQTNRMVVNSQDERIVDAFGGEEAADAADEPSEKAESFVSFDRQPGDLAPHYQWCYEVRDRCQRLRIDQEMGMLLDTLQKKLNRRALTTDELVRFVESVDRKLWDAIFTLGQPPLSEQQRKDERDQWILTRWNEGGTWKRIVKKLKEIAAERNWRALADIPTVRRAAITYAKKTSQNMRKGQGGRPKSAD